MTPDMLLDRLALAVCVAIGVSAPMSVAVYILKETFLKTIRVVESLQDTLQSIQISYPQRFVEWEKLQPKCQKHDDMIYNLDSEVKVIKNRLDMKE